MRDYLYRKQERAIKRIATALDAAHKAGLAIFVVAGTPIAYDVKCFDKLEAAGEDGMQALQREEIPCDYILTDAAIDGGDF